MNLFSIILWTIAIGVPMVIILAFVVFGGDKKRKERRKEEIRQKVLESRTTAAIKESLPALRWKQIASLISEALKDTRRKSLIDNEDRLFLQEAREKLRRKEPVDGPRIVEALRALECFIYAGSVEEALTYIQNPDSDPVLKDMIDREVDRILEAESAPAVSSTSSSDEAGAFAAGFLSATLIHHAQKEWEKERAEWREWRFK